jgi:P27 family predicted phage terminase small subunit
MARGRKADSPAVQAAKGNPGKRAQRKPAAVPEAAEIADAAPDQLTDVGKAIWRRLRPHLVQMKLLRATDEPVFVRYCDTLAEFWKVQKAVRKHGTTYLAPMTGGVGKMRRIDPRFNVASRLKKELIEMEDRLGLNPRARQEQLMKMAQAAGTQLPGELPLGDQGASAGEDETVRKDSPIGYLQ